MADTFSAHEQAALLESTYVEYNLANLARLQRSYEGVRELVAELDAAGVRCGIVTSKRTATAHLSLEAAGLDAMIEVLGAMEDSTHHKPHPEPLLNALAKLGSTGEGVVYVGDATVDLLAASAAGLAGVGVLWGAGRPGGVAARGDLRDGFRAPRGAVRHLRGRGVGGCR